jgi:SNF2 family DNA or RNA helicase
MHNLRHWVVINYDSFWRDPISDVLATSEWGAIIYDEVHKTKSPGSKASMMARRLRPRGKVRILATGTPMAHSPLDAYGIMRAGNDQILGKSYIAFKQRYALWAGPNNRIRVGFQNITELEEKLAPVTWRATKEEVLPDLPEKSDVDYETTLSPEAAKVYRNLEKNLISEINGNTLTAANILTKILRLQQICGGAVPDDDGKYHQIDDSKRKLLMDVVEDLGDKPFVVFCRFRSDIDAAHQACREMGVEALELSGQYNQLERWQNGEAQALIVQMQSGSTGINLTRASTAIYYSLSTSLAEWDQSQARIHRPGQKNACTYIYLLIKGTVDMKILKALRGRLEVVTAIMNNIQQRHEEAQ